MTLDRPIPAFYCCYLLRSTIRHGSVYIGSTPNPVRRLRQHNGLAKGGAVRTSRNSLRPWEMACIVTGFPSHIAALQFEWAWQNPHITLHIPPESRIQHATSKKRSGQPKRPRHSVTSLLSNLHLLLRVPSFSRWPLQIRFFSEDVHKAWLRWSKTTSEPIRDTIDIITDFSTEHIASDNESGSPTSKRRKVSKTGGGIAALSVDYTDQKLHVEKGRTIIEFEQEGSCAICKKELGHDLGIYTICPNSECKSLSHITCLSKHFLQDEQEDILIPLKGKCPSCKTELRWVDITKELSLRMRGQKEVEKLLKVKRPRKTKGITASQIEAMASSSEDEDDVEEAEDEIEDELRRLSKDDQIAAGTQMGDEWNLMDDESDSDTQSIASASQALRGASFVVGKAYPKASAGLRTVVEDSDWEDALEL